MKNVLIISYIYPPGPRTGAERILKFRKFLPEFHYQTFVLTTRIWGTSGKDREEGVFRAYDLRSSYGSLPEVPLIQEQIRGNHGFRAAIPVASEALKNIIREWAVIPDASISWLPFAVSVGLKLSRAGKIDIIFSTFGPATNHLVGLIISKMTGIPLIADFRDGWLFESIQPFLRNNRYRRLVDGGLESRVIHHASAMTTVSDPLTEYLRENSNLPPERVVTITNGYDADDWLMAQPAKKGGMCRIVHTGSFSYSGFNRSVHPLIKGISLLSRYLRDSLEVLLIGNMHLEEQQLINRYDLANVIKILPKVTKVQSLGYQLSADLLLLMVGQDRSVATSKLYEYLYARRPILVIGNDETAAAKIVKSTRTGVVVPSENPSAIAKAIEQMIERWQRNDLRVLTNADITMFSRRNLTQRLAGIFDNVLAEKQ